MLEKSYLLFLTAAAKYNYWPGSGQMLQNTGTPAHNRCKFATQITAAWLGF